MPLASSQTGSSSQTWGKRSKLNCRYTHIQGRNLKVNLEVTAPVGSISERQVNLVHDFLERELKRPIFLDVSIFPLQEYSIQQTEQKEAAEREATDKPRPIRNL